MRKSILFTGMLILAVISTMFTSCKKDVPFGEALIGKWIVQSERQIYSLNDEKKSEHIFYYEADELAYEFTPGGSLIIYFSGYNPMTYSYTLSGNKITIDTGMTTIEWEKASIDGSTLIWSEFTTDLIENISYDIEIIYTAVKQ